MEGFTNANFEKDEKLNSGGKDDKLPASAEMLVAQPDPPPVSEELEESRHRSNASDAVAEIEEGNEGVDSEKEVRSILTKERREADDGYKAVWFREDIDPEARDDDVTIEEYSDAERNRNESDSDNADDRDDNEDGEENDRGRGGSDVSAVLGRAPVPGGNSTISEFQRDGEANDIYF